VAGDNTARPSIMPAAMHAGAAESPLRGGGSLPLLRARTTTAPAPLAVCCYHMGTNGHGQPGRVHSRALHRRHHHPYIAIDIAAVLIIVRMRFTGLRGLPESSVPS
jgi:hypothetical protein